MRCGLDWCSVTPYCHVAGLLPWDRHHAEVIFVHLGIRLAFGKSIALQAAWSVQRKAVLQISEFREGFAFLVCEHTGASCVDARISMDAATSHRSLARRALAAARCALVAAARSLPLDRRPLARSPGLGLGLGYGGPSREKSPPPPLRARALARDCVPLPTRERRPGPHVEGVGTSNLPPKH